MNPAITKIAGSTAIAISLSAGAVMAHHGVTGLYDTSGPIILAGTVTGTVFTPPHPVISVRVEAAEPKLPAAVAQRTDEFAGTAIVRSEDVGKVRDIEFSPVRTFYDLADTVKVGDRVLIVALRNCRPPHQLRSSWMQLSDGQIVSYEGGLHRRADGCP